MIYSKYSRNNAGVAAVALAIGLLSAPSAWAFNPPVAHYTFDQGVDDYSVVTAIDSANANDGVWQNVGFDGLAYTGGVIGGAVSLRGATDDYFLIPSIPQIDGIEPTPFTAPQLGVGITVSAWMYVDDDAPSGYKGIFKSRDVTSENISGVATGRDWGLAWEGGDHIDTRVHSSGVDSNDGSITRNQWHHVALVWGNVDAEAPAIPPASVIYVDGVKQANVVENTEVFNLVTSGAWLIGEDSCCGGREFPGLLDDLAMFGEALSDADIATLYSNGLSGIDAAGNATGIILPGDVNQDESVTIADFNIIRDNMGLAATARSQGDLNGNKRVDLNDFRVWLDAAPAAAAAEALATFSLPIPEPSSLLLVLATGPLSASRRRAR
ncbi:hypothetical protein Pla123a_32000 [Posidoniimonas polymericola]|uniref:LamG-like jellyroll fold domain-containing protein n=1 Tax=Posidoniimonas polymericola TaxID=2528002 RepID=A0A5C5YLB4_9BACT|nr:LamG-like jellyroll fold domain-containing protein [Posidoniimonas polymericola]TWT75690.1 hypothetical protein Pla123a_32000 [Posidoniimonas polymericola]